MTRALTGVRVALGLAAAKLVLQLVALSAYGYFRDELYYLACADHLAWGYVDHPPFSIAVLAAWRAVFGDSAAAIRLVPALAGAALVYVTGRIAIELGGSAIAVALACLAVIAAPEFVATDHYYSMNALDHLVWAVAALLAMRRRWLPLGVVLGIGLLNKASVLWFGAGLTVFLIAYDRASLRTRGPYLAAGLAALFFLPNVIWQATHGFPTAEFARNAMAEKYVHLSIIDFVHESTMSMNPFSAPLVVAGATLPFAKRTGRLGPTIFLVTFAIILLAKAKPEYLAAAYPLVFASGAVVLSQKRWLCAVVALGMVAMLGVALPFALPILSEESFIAYANRFGIAPSSSEKKEMGALPQFYADMHGWPELVRAASVAWDSIPAEERAHAKIWARTGGYGSAAAIDVLGKRHGLPHALATHNNYWLWGYGDDTDGPVVVLGGSRERVEQTFRTVTYVSTIDCGYCMPYENDKPVWIGRGLKRPWSVIWPELKHYE